MNTPKQRPSHQSALEAAAAAPRKSYLGRFTPLTGIQSAWIKSLLTVWAEGMRGSTAPRKPRAQACWRFSKNQRWSDAALERFTTALSQAREEGYRGKHAVNRAHAISRQFIAQIVFLDDGENDGRWLSIAKTEMQSACMATCRAVYRPDENC